MIKLAKDAETLLLTKEVAVKHSTMTPLPGERELKPSHMEYLESLVRDGLFTTCYWIVVWDKKTGKLHRVDGQHSSTMLARLPAELFPAGIQVVMTTYVSDDLEADTPALFEMCNNPHSVRNNADKMGFYRSSYKELAMIPSRFLVQVAAGYHYYLRASAVKNGHNPKMWDTRNHGQYLNDAPPLRSFSLWLYKWEKAAAEGNKVPNRWIISKPGIVSVVYESWKTDPKIATEFWGHVMLDDHPSRDDVSRELSRILNKWRVGSEKKSQNMYHRQSSNAWQGEWRKRNRK